MGRERKLHWYMEGNKNGTLCKRPGYCVEEESKVTCGMCIERLSKLKELETEDQAGEQAAIEEPAKPAKPAKADEPPPEPTKRRRPKGLLTLAYDAMVEAGEPLTCGQCVEYAQKQGWTGEGLTPTNTLNASINTEIKKKGDEARFRRVSKGLYTVNN